MAGRFNKILEFIGLVDDEPDEELDQGRRPVGGQTYGAQSRRAAPQAAPRANYDERQGSRYSSPRPEYDARTRRTEAQSAPRYGAGSDYRPGASQRAEYAPRQEYSSARDGYRSQRAPQRDSLEDEFERSARPARDSERSRPNVVPMRASAPSHQTVIYYLRQLGECRDVINDLLDNKTVLLNLEDMDERVVQRGIDTLCGAAFALGATLRKASDKTYLIAPKSVEVASTNDEQDRY